MGNASSFAIAWRRLKAMRIEPALGYDAFCFRRTVFPFTAAIGETIGRCLPFSNGRRPLLTRAPQVHDLAH